MKLNLAAGIFLLNGGVEGWSVPCTKKGMWVGSISLKMGIMDEVNSDSFLLGKSDGDKKQQRTMEDAYEIFLAELVFSPNDPRMDIIDNVDRAMDEGFRAFLGSKADACTDVEEKMALKNLAEMIEDIAQKIELSAAAEERRKKEQEEEERFRLEEAERLAASNRALSDAEVLQKASSAAVQGAAPAEAPEKKTFYESEIPPEIRLSYESLLQKLLPPYKPGTTPHSVILNNYDQCDAQLVKILTERKDQGDADAAALLEALAEEQQNRISQATSTLKEVLSLGEEARMIGAIVKLARDGKIDEPFLLLLEANAEMALQAGATQPAQLMKRLKNRAEEEKDKQTASKEIRLLRKLLRAESADERTEILEEAFTPKEALIVPGTMENAQKAVDGEMPEQAKPMPSVQPPEFIKACKALLLNFGNLVADDAKGDVATRVKEIASEAEVVATRIFGKGMSVEEHQDRMWKEETTSIFDLERMEIEAERMGERAPWTNENDDDIIPGFDKDGRMKVGGT